VRSQAPPSSGFKGANPLTVAMTIPGIRPIAAL
jgi:hypothetical protein